MADTYQSTVQVSVTCVGSGLGPAVNAPPATVNAAAPDGGPHTLALGSATNVTLTAPSGAAGVIWYGAASTVVMKGAAGDTGISIVAGSVVCFPITAANTFVLYSAGGDSVFVQWT